MTTSQELKLDTEEDLFALIRLMTNSGRVQFLRIVNDMRTNAITSQKASEDVKSLLLKHGIIEEEKS